MRQCDKRRFNRIILHQCGDKALTVSESRVPISIFTSVENILTSLISIG